MKIGIHLFYIALKEDKHTQGQVYKHFSFCFQNVNEGIKQNRGSTLKRPELKKKTLAYSSHIPKTLMNGFAWLDFLYFYI